MNEAPLREKVAILVESAVVPNLKMLFDAAAVEIRVNSEVIYSGGFGLDASGDPVTPETLFDLGELTELFTAAALLKLVDSGRLWFDTPVSVVLGDADDGLTTLHLLTHAGGLPQSVALDRLREYDARIAFIEKSTPSKALIGLESRYSPLHYMQLGLMIEALTGLPLDQAMAELILQPLGLRAQYNPPGREPADINARALDNVGGHAGLFGGVADVGGLAQLFLSSGEWAGDRFIGEPVLMEALHEHFPTQGFAWSIDGDIYARVSSTGAIVTVDEVHELICTVLTDTQTSGPSNPNAPALHELCNHLYQSIVTMLDQE